MANGDPLDRRFAFQGNTSMTLYKWSQTASADATADSTINWAEGQAPSSVNDSARAMMAATAKFRDDIAGSVEGHLPRDIHGRAAAGRDHVAVAGWP